MRHANQLPCILKEGIPGRNWWFENSIQQSEDLCPALNTWQLPQVLFTLLFTTGRIFFLLFFTGLFANSWCWDGIFSSCVKNHFAVCMQWNSFEQREGCVTKGSMASRLFILIPCLLPHLYWLFYSRFCARQQKRMACRRVLLRFFSLLRVKLSSLWFFPLPSFLCVPFILPDFCQGIDSV